MLDAKCFSGGYLDTSAGIESLPASAAPLGVGRALLLIEPLGLWIGAALLELAPYSLKGGSVELERGEHFWDPPNTMGNFDLERG